MLEKWLNIVIMIEVQIKKAQAKMYKHNVDCVC